MGLKKAVLQKDWPGDLIERQSVELLLPQARNARTHWASQAVQLAVSITEWGWTNPILGVGDTTIIAGHG